MLKLDTEKKTVLLTFASLALSVLTGAVTTALERDWIKQEVKKTNQR